MKLQSTLIREKENHEKNPRSKVLTKALEAGITKLNLYFEYAKTSETAIIATILNPYYKFGKLHALGWSTGDLQAAKKLFLQTFDHYKQVYNPTNEVESEDEFLSDDEDIYYGVEHIASTPEPEEGRVLNDAEKYLNSLPIKRHKNSLQDVSYKGYWKTYESPILVRMARDYSTIMATSVPSESVFSIAGLIITRLRNKLSPDTMEKIMCLKSWGLLDDVLIEMAEVMENEVVETKSESEEVQKELVVEEEGYDLTRKGDADVIIV